MKQVIPVLAIFLGSITVKGQPVFNKTLKAELDSIFIEDQLYRELLPLVFTDRGRDSLALVYKLPADSIRNYLFKKLYIADSLNMQRVVQIIDQYGYPGKKLVGSPTNEAAYFIIQHSTKIAIYLPLIKKAAKEKELSFSLYAMMLDRSLMYNNKEQVYGTQGKGFEAINSVTGNKEWKMIIWPIKKPATVNKRRKKAGFPNTAEENAKMLGINYEVLTLEDVKKMQAH